MIPKELIKKVKQLEINTRKIIESTVSGKYQSAFKGKGINFSDLREYQVGDDIRNINWKASARSNTTYTNLYEEERELTVLLMIDISQSGRFGSQVKTKQELAAEIAAILGFAAVKNSDKVGLLLFSDQIEAYIPAKKGKDHMLRILRDIYYTKPVGKKTNINEALTFTMNMISKRSIIFLISDFIDQNYEHQLKIAAKKHDLIPILTEDPLELELPKKGILAFEDFETKEIVYINSSSDTVQNAYKNICYANQLEKHRLFKSCNCDFLNLKTNEDYTLSLIQFFQRRLK